ncbi:hypothetical protein [uncultured Methanobrevibacter sp.]|uniref:hypothetical protein n=1 Tax=uncultured Methanobrevibacter sp. TaxID=253161 RepID=UPI0025ECB24B|nr:hypothetical protein [uncultured Methanobrevibacter sp.]
MSDDRRAKERKCLYCENYRDGFSGPYCVEWEEEPMGPCDFFEFNDFSGVNKRLDE